MSESLRFGVGDSLPWACDMCDDGPHPVPPIKWHGPPRERKAERDRYREALEKIAYGATFHNSRRRPLPGALCVEIAHRALQGEKKGAA